MPDTPTRFFRRRDGRLHPIGWALLFVVAALFIGMALIVLPSASSGPALSKQADSDYSLHQETAGGRPR